MKPTPEIIDLARRFHELGGDEGYKIQCGDWYFYSDGCGESSGHLKLCSSRGVGIAESYCIPIHDADFLYKFLLDHKAKFIQEDRAAYIDIAESHGVTYALYVACNQILRWEKEKP